MLRGVAVLKSNYREGPTMITKRRETLLFCSYPNYPNGTQLKNLNKVVLPRLWHIGSSPAISQVTLLDILMLQKILATPVLQIDILSLPFNELTYPLLRLLGRWFSSSMGGICSQEGPICMGFLLQVFHCKNRWWSSPTQRKKSKQHTSLPGFPTLEGVNIPHQKNVKPLLLPWRMGWCFGRHNDLHANPGNDVWEGFGVSNLQRNASWQPKKTQKINYPPGNNISPPKGTFESMMIFPFPRWDKWVPWRIKRLVGK